jgi:hypothetical protein
LLTGRLFQNLQQHGFVENFLSVMYYIGAALSRYDQNSHMLAILLVSPDNGMCGNYATTPVPACSAHYGTQPPFAPAASRATRRFRRPRSRAPRPGRTPVPSGSIARPRPANAASPPAGGSAGSPPAAPPSAPGVAATARGIAQAAATAAAAATGASSQQGGGSLQNLANYLLR